MLVHIICISHVFGLFLLHAMRCPVWQQGGQHHIGPVLAAGSRRDLDTQIFIVPLQVQLCMVFIRAAATIPVCGNSTSQPVLGMCNWKVFIDRGGVRGSLVRCQLMKVTEGDCVYISPRRKPAHLRIETTLRSRHTISHPLWPEQLEWGTLIIHVQSEVCL